MEHRPLPRPRAPSDANSDAPAAATTPTGVPAASAPSAAGSSTLSSAASHPSPGDPPPPKRSRTSEGAPGQAAARERAGVPKVSYPKKRVNVACEVCRSRKTRCDAARPSCSFCAEIGAQCVYRRPEETSRPDESPELRTSVPKVSALDEHEVISRLARIEGLLQLAVPRSDTSSHGSPSLKVPGESEPQNHIPSPQSSSDSYSIVRPPYSMGTPKFAFGFDLIGMARLSELPIPKELLPLFTDPANLEWQLRQELNQDAELFQSGYTPLDTLDLNHRRCWQLKESFSSAVLPWCPIIDQRECTEVVSRAVEAGFEPYSLDTAMTLFVFAGGAFAQECQHYADEASGFPGLAYFRAACQIVDLDRVNGHTIRYVQCHILMAIYLLYCLRPVHAYEAIQKAAHRIVLLLQLESGFRGDAAYHQRCLRAYWACYLIEHELQVFVPWSSQLLQDINENMAFPSSDWDEPGMYFFLAEITLRRIFSRPRHGVTWNQMYSIFEPLVAQEVSAQVTNWHSRLPEMLRFSLDESIPMQPILDPQKGFLRAQYYAVQTTLFWPYVVRMLSVSPADAGVRAPAEPMDPEQVARLAARSLRYAVVHMFAVEPLLRYRHLMLLADQTGTYTITMLLVSAYGAEALRGVQHPRMREAIVMGWRFMKTWESNPGLRARVARIEGIMRTKGMEEAG